ncbi:MAG: hypothetical protein WA851_08395 [Xanthobacteraceae bacterium]
MPETPLRKSLPPLCFFSVLSEVIRSVISLLKLRKWRHVRDIEHKPRIALDHRQKHAGRPGGLPPPLFPVTKGFNGHADEIGEHLLRGTYAAARPQPDGIVIS